MQIVMSPPFSMWGWGGIQYHCCPYVRPGRPVHNTNGFCAMSFERISVLD